MPNRVLKDSITCSKEIDSLTWFQEVLFYRLIVKADDFGRYHADPQIVKSELFPRKEDLTKKTVSAGLEVLENTGLIKRYAWDGNEYLQITKWENHQQRRATKSKYPDSNGNHVITSDNNCNQLISDDNNGKQMSPNTNTNTNTRSGTRVRAREESSPASDSFITDEEAKAIQADQNEILDEMEAIGLQNTAYNRKQLIDNLYPVYGKEAVIHGLKEAARLNKISAGYIESVAKNYCSQSTRPEVDETEALYLKTEKMLKDLYGEG